ncbi:hypothetical protein SAMN05444064_101138 [Pseudomonas syringae]|nr:hypothetical protein SAMN05444514_101140 [Pseudomonas syringae]SFL36759.1 hypothetical protein SAMN05444064_101138 [Pseudomonas syringae]
MPWEQTRACLRFFARKLIALMQGSGELIRAG